MVDMKALSGFAEKITKSIREALNRGDGAEVKRLDGILDKTNKMGEQAVAQMQEGGGPPAAGNTPPEPDFGMGAPMAHATPRPAAPTMGPQDYQVDAPVIKLPPTGKPNGLVAPFPALAEEEMFNREPKAKSLRLEDYQKPFFGGSITDLFKDKPHGLPEGITSGRKAPKDWVKDPLGTPGEAFDLIAPEIKKEKPKAKEAPKTEAAPATVKPLAPIFPKELQPILDYKTSGTLNDAKQDLPVGEKGVGEQLASMIKDAEKSESKKRTDTVEGELKQKFGEAPDRSITLERIVSLLLNGAPRTYDRMNQQEDRHAARRDAEYQRYDATKERTARHKKADEQKEQYNEIQRLFAGAKGDTNSIRERIENMKEGGRNSRSEAGRGSSSFNTLLMALSRAQDEETRNLVLKKWAEGFGGSEGEVGK